MGDVFRGKRVSGHEDHLLWEVIRESKVVVEVPMASEEEVQPMFISDEEEIEMPSVIEEELPEAEINPLELDQPLAEIISAESEA